MKRRRELRREVVFGDGKRLAHPKMGVFAAASQRQSNEAYNERGEKLHGIASGLSVISATLLTQVKGARSRGAQELAKKSA